MTVWLVLTVKNITIRVGKPDSNNSYLYLSCEDLYSYVSKPRQRPITNSNPLAQCGEQRGEEKIEKKNWSYQIACHFMDD